MSGTPPGSFYDTVVDIVTNMVQNVYGLIQKQKQFITELLEERQELEKLIQTLNEKLKALEQEAAIP
jgi:cell shape-determining protein MreC